MSTHSKTYTLDRWRVGPSADGTSTQVCLTVVPPTDGSNMGFNEFGPRTLELGGLPEAVLPSLVRGAAITITVSVPDVSA